MIETIGKIILIIACLYMAGLNLWLEFKSWFGKKYQRKDNTAKSAEQKAKTQNEERPDFVGKSKYNMQEAQAEREKQIQEQKEQPNPVIHSEQLEREPLPDDNPEEDIPLPAGPQSKVDVELQGSQSITTDEFELLAKTLSGQKICNGNEVDVKEILLKTKGTDLFNQLVRQVKGAEEITNSILKESDVEVNTKNSMFDFGKYLRK